MKTPFLSALILAAVALPLAAQTATPKPATPAHTTAVHRAAGGCVKLPEVSSKIPALPSDAPCAKVLYTITKTSETKLDYASPLVSPEVRAELAGGSSTYSLDYIDTKIGTGPLALPGKFYTVHYTGYLLKDGTKFDSSVDRGDPITFPYGGHRVIPGWDTGFEGMHVGGKRRLFIPYQLAYGDAGHPPVIPGKSMLVFDLEFIAQGDTQPAPKQPARRPPPVPRPGTPGATPTPPGTSVPAPGSTPPATAPGTAAPATAPPTVPPANAPAATASPTTTPPPTTTTPSKPQQ